MAYLEIMKKEKKNYYYLSTTVRYKGKFKKIRKYLGCGHIPQEKLGKLIERNRELLRKRVEAIKEPKIEIKLEDISTRQKEELEEIKNSYQSAINKLDKIEYEVYEKDYLIKFTFNTNAIEGSTITLKDTLHILEDHITPKGKSLREVHEVENTKEAYDFLKKYKGDVDTKLIKQIHNYLTHNILGKNSGVFRKIQVYMGGSKHIPPKAEDVSKEMTELIKWYKKNKNKYHLVFVATYIHNEFIAIHPFIDGNGRTGRLLLNFMLMKNGYPPICIKKEERIEYTDRLETARDGNLKSFLNFIIKYIKEVEIPIKRGGGK